MIYVVPPRLRHLYALTDRPFHNISIIYLISSILYFGLAIPLVLSLPRQTRIPLQCRSLAHQAKYKPIIVDTIVMYTAKSLYCYKPLRETVISILVLLSSSFQMSFLFAGIQQISLSVHPQSPNPRNTDNGIDFQRLIKQGE